ncbi:PREDICTED: nuclear receptor corepressor 2-like, partial [Chlamydotis macqueenii]|uniref:nuclear receptor corepressor 2-like n=1 Tax=Chlamydotis macqueenii TaxID=187382 RepID=UPI0005298404
MRIEHVTAASAGGRNVKLRAQQNKGLFPEAHQGAVEPTATGRAEMQPSEPGVNDPLGARVRWQLLAAGSADRGGFGRPLLGEGGWGNQAMRKKLILYFKRRNHARKQWEQKFCQRYDQLMEAWEKKVERIENNPRRRAKESKVREYYEKQFPEIRKQRELQERMQSRVGQRGSGGLSMSAARSEHEVSEIIDGLSEQENLEKQMRQLAVIPPMLYDADQQRIKFINMNGLMDDPMKVYKDRQVMNMWSEQEKETFREKFMQHPKNFGLIASFLDRKTVADCVLYYYLTKKNENYKNLVRRNYRRRGKSQ